MYISDAFLMYVKQKEIDAIRGEVSTWKMQEQQRQGDIETALLQSRTRAEAEAVRTEELDYVDRNSKS